MIIKELLTQAIEILKNNNIENPISKAKIILAHVINVPKEQLIVRSEESISKDKEDTYIKNINSLASGIPLQYITNSAEFMGLEFYVDENVLIPQPDTEILVEAVEAAYHAARAA